MLQLDFSSSRNNQADRNLEHGCEEKNANLLGLLALPLRIGEFSCVPPHNKEENPLGTKLMSTIFGKWSCTVCTVSTIKAV